MATRIISMNTVYTVIIYLGPPGTLSHHWRGAWLHNGQHRNRNNGQRKYNHRMAQKPESSIIITLPVNSAVITVNGTPVIL